MSVQPSGFWKKASSAEPRIVETERSEDADLGHEWVRVFRVFRCEAMENAEWVGTNMSSQFLMHGSSRCDTMGKDGTKEEAKRWRAVFN
ncbi:hypothetical protein DI43_17070 [Geobacillus sp. CAMR12739]|nr:hypothetical protein DI43_17070 [Geobacillus sp. CAMR12739]